MPHDHLEEQGETNIYKLVFNYIANFDSTKKYPIV